MRTYGTFIAEVKLLLSPLYGSEEAKAIGIRLLERVCGASMWEHVVEPERVIDEVSSESLDKMVKELLRGRPLQYVTGFQQFMGRDFKVSEGVLIPRPETEELVSWIKDEHRSGSTLKILDAATGSGCIGVSLACELPGSEVYMTDISSKALKISKENAERICSEERLKRANVITPVLFRADLLTGALSQAAFSGGTLDIIVSNPPYVLESEKSLMRSNVLDYEPHEALFVPDSDPLLYYKALANWAKDLLKDGGALYMELNEAKGLETAELFMEREFCDVELRNDINGKMRMLRCIYKEN